MRNKVNKDFNPDKLLSIAFSTKLIRRSSYKIDPYSLLISFFSTLSLGYYSLREWAAQYETLTGNPVSFQAIHKKFNDRGLDFLKSTLKVLFQSALNDFDGKYNSSINYFKRVILEDSTCIKLSQALMEAFSGNSNGTTRRPIGRIQMAFDLKSGNWLNGYMGTYKMTDAKYATDITERVEPGDLVIRDLGYWNQKAFKSFVDQGVYFLSKLKVGALLFNEKGEAYDIMKSLKALDKKGIKNIDQTMQLGTSKITVRMVGYKLSPEQAARKYKASKKSRHRSQPMSKLAKYLTTWNIFITNIESEKCNTEELIKLYKLRWYIEIMFKNWKSNYDFEKFVAAPVGPDPIKPEVLMYLHLIYMAAIFQPAYKLFDSLLNQIYGKQLSPLKFAKRIIDKLDAYIELLIGKGNNMFKETELRILSRYYTYEKRKDRSNMQQDIRIIFF